MAIITPNMGLTVWDLLTDFFSHDTLKADYQLIDLHDHSAGKGIQIPTDGLGAGAVTSAKLAVGAVTTAAIADGSITNPKFATGTAVAPIGAVTDYAGASDPSATWLICDGRAISRTTYGTLFSALATTYGAGNGTTTFNIPDFRGRVAVGAGTGSGLTNRARGARDGEEGHTLTFAEVPPLPIATANPLAGAGGQYVPLSDIKDDNWLIGSGGAGSNMVNPSGGSAHNNMQPWLAVNKIIRAL